MPASPRLSPIVLAARQQLAEGRAQLFLQHRNGSPGIQVCNHLSELLDSVVLTLFQASLSAIEDPELEHAIALIPNGGYGRRDVAPFSDVDLMLLTTPQAQTRAGELARHLSRNICDAGLQLGFCFRTVKECISLVQKDPVIFTSLAESRLLAGNPQLFRHYMDRLQRTARRRWKSLVGAVIEARRVERRKYGETVYMLEPNLKRSRGGLRDVQLVRWIGFARFGHSELESLFRVGAMTRPDRRRLLGSLEFLLRLRNEMHFHAEKGQDVLVRHEQVRLAEHLGYQRQAGLLPVERFMRDYFERTADVRYVSAHFVSGVQAASGITSAVAGVFSHRVENDFRVGPVHIRATRQGLVKVCSDLAEVLRIMDLANLYHKRIDHATWEAIRNAMSHARHDQISTATVHRFLSLLSQPGRLADLLRRLHQLRVLECIIPAMKHARSLLQFNDYHKYTIDEHCIRSVECATRFQDDPRLVGDVYRRLHNKRLLHLALLLHDLGKGYDEDHSEVGAQIAADTAQRLNLSPEDSDVLRFLVAKHLLMSHTALRQDLGDPSVILKFAFAVGSPEVLQMLYVHSCADLAAVGPGTLTDWKLDLMSELYQLTLQHLTAEDGPAQANERIESARSALRQSVDTRDDVEWWDRQIRAMPAAFLNAIPLDRLKEVLVKLRELGPTNVAAWSRYVPERKATVYLVGAYENVTPGIFHKLTGALTGKGLEILSAEIHDIEDGLVLDRFTVLDRDFSGTPPENRRDAVCRSLVDALTVNAQRPPVFRRIWESGHGAKASQFSELPTQIRLDDATSERHTIITIFAYDRRGLLYSIARTLFELGLSVHGARIGTYLDQVVDVFYVTDQEGRKIYDDRLRSEIRRQLELAIQPPEG